MLWIVIQGNRQAELPGFVETEKDKLIRLVRVHMDKDRNATLSWALPSDVGVIYAQCQAGNSIVPCKVHECWGVVSSTNFCWVKSFCSTLKCALSGTWQQFSLCATRCILWLYLPVIEESNHYRGHCVHTWLENHSGNTISQWDKTQDITYNISKYIPWSLAHDAWPFHPSLNQITIWSVFYRISQWIHAIRCTHSWPRLSIPGCPHTICKHWWIW